MPDEIVPMPLVDQGVLCRMLSVNAYLIVNGRLQPEILCEAFKQLVTLWPKLGARLVQNREGRLEYHIPKTYTDDRPPFRFTVEEHAGEMCSLPSRTTTIQEGTYSMHHIFHHASCPQTLTELLSQDQPLISIHVGRYDNVTCVGVNIPHVLVDAEGAGIILKAWCSLIAEKVHEVPSLIDGDALADFGLPYPSTKAEEEEFLASIPSSLCRWSTWDMIRTTFNSILEFIFYPRARSGMFFLPSKLVASIRQKAMLELRNGDDREGPWLSENDIVTAILFKLNSFCKSNNDKTLCYPMFNASMRGHIPCLPKGGPSVHIHNNAIPFGLPPVPTSDLRYISIAQLALGVRNAIISQRTVENMKKIVTLFRESSRRRVFPGLYPSNGTACMITSWTSNGWADLDFSPALEPSFPEKRSDPDAGKVLFAGGRAALSGHFRRMAAIIMSKHRDDTTGEGGYWCAVAGRANAFPKMQEYLTSLLNVYTSTGTQHGS